MNAQHCDREGELLDSLGGGFVGAELRAHVETCVSCSELHVVAGALLDERAHAMMEAPIPSGGSVWWRMRVRHRHDAEASARRTLLIGQAATLTIALSLLFVFFGSELLVAARHLIATVRLSTPLLLVLATWVLVVPVAGWVAIRQK